MMRCKSSKPAAGAFTFLVMGLLLTSGCGSSKTLTRSDMVPVEQRLQNVESELAAVSAQTLAEIEALHQRVSQNQGAGAGIRFHVIETLTISFPLNSADLTPDATGLLDRLAARLTTAGSALLYVRGYADARGTSEYNLRLSALRAEAVSRHLSNALGNLAVPVATLGLGESNPVGDNGNAVGRAANRRAVVQVVVPMRGVPQVGPG